METVKKSQKYIHKQQILYIFILIYKFINNQPFGKTVKIRTGKFKPSVWVSKQVERRRFYLAMQNELVVPENALASITMGI